MRCNDEGKDFNRFGDLINEKIFLDLEIFLITKKLEKSKLKNDQHVFKFFEGILDEKFKEVKTVNELL
jgi:hypothetical protein